MGIRLDDFLDDFPTVSRELALAVLDEAQEALARPALLRTYSARPLRAAWPIRASAKPRARSAYRIRLSRIIRAETEPYGTTVAKIRAWYPGEANELDRLRQEVEELKRKLAACEAKLRKRE